MKKSDNGSMSLTGHLSELRKRLVICVACFLAAMLLCLSSAPRLVTVLTELGKRYQYTYVYLAPQELLSVYFGIALLGGLILSAPVIAYHAYAFASPGLKRQERLFFLLALTFGALAFALGVCFAYFVTTPFILSFLISLRRGVEIAAAISVQEYVNFLLTLFLIFGLIFELPVVSVLLTQLGILKPVWLAKSRKAVIVLIFFVAAVITPPDVASQVLVAVPMIGLFELSVLLSRICYRLRKPEEASEPVVK